MPTTASLPPATPPPTPPPAAASVLLRQIGALAGPTTALSLLQVGAQLVETVLAARQGTAALAGWAGLLTFALLLAQMSTGAMGGGVVAAVARALGGQRRDEASALVLHAMLIATAGGLLFAVGVSLLAGPLVRAVAGAEAAAHAAPYAWWLFGAGAVPAWWTNTLASVLRGGGQHALAARVLGWQWAAMPASSCAAMCNGTAFLPRPAKRCCASSAGSSNPSTPTGCSTPVGSTPNSEPARPHADHAFRRI